MGKKVGIVDADIYGPSQPTLLGTTEKPHAENDKLVPVEVQGIKLLSVGQLVSPGQALAWRGPMASGALNQLIEGDWGDTELSWSTCLRNGDVQLSLVQKSRPAGAVIVSTPQDLSLIDATRAIDLFGKTGVPCSAIIENMAGYQCRIAARAAIRSARAARKPRQRAGRALPWPVAACRPALRAASDAGRRPPQRTGRPATLSRKSPVACLRSWKKSPPEALFASGGSLLCRSPVTMIFAHCSPRPGR
jgi:ATP-binding protein involved in chromosome partitioning